MKKMNQMKKIISVLAIFAMLVNLFSFSMSINVKAAELDANYGHYTEIEGETTEVTLKMSGDDDETKTSVKKSTISIANYVTVSITPKSGSYLIRVYNIGVDTIDKISLTANVKKNNGTHLASGSKTFKKVKPGFVTWEWKLSKGETVQEHITVNITARDGSSVISASGSTVRYNFAGGKYGDLKAYDGQRHHMPSDSVDGLSKRKGAAVRMITSEHKKTASYGSSKKAKEFRKEEKKYIEQGEFLKAQQLGVKDVQSNFGKKYNAAINDMIKYTKSLGYTK